MHCLPPEACFVAPLVAVVLLVVVAAAMLALTPYAGTQTFQSARVTIPQSVFFGQEAAQ